MGRSRARRAGAEAFRAERRINRAPAFGGSRKGRGKLVARPHRGDTGEARRFVARYEHWTFELLQALVPRRYEEGRAARPAVEQYQGARHLDAGQIEELVVLPERHVQRVLGRALQHGNAIADRGQHLCAAGGEFLRRKDGGEQRRLSSVRGCRQRHRQRRRA